VRLPNTFTLNGLFWLWFGIFKTDSATKQSTNRRGSTQPPNHPTLLSMSRTIIGLGYAWVHSEPLCMALGHPQALRTTANHSENPSKNHPSQLHDVCGSWRIILAARSKPISGLCKQRICLLRFRSRCSSRMRVYLLCT